MPRSVTLFCIPFAGGNAYSYRPLQERMHPSVKIVVLEPPGRGRRSREPRVAGMHEMAQDLLAGIRPALDRPFALFGHSMGGLAAYLLGCRLLEEGLPLPLHLFISGKGPPQTVSREAHWHALPIGEFTERLAELGGCPAAVLADRELMAYFAPIIRDDMRAIASYRHREAAALPVPLTVMIGTAESTTSAEAAKWSEATSSEFRSLQFEGGHFFLFDHLDEICGLMRSTLAPS